jgi:hypothetical protein
MDNPLAVFFGLSPAFLEIPSAFVAARKEILSEKAR